MRLTRRMHELERVVFYRSTAAPQVTENKNIQQIPSNRKASTKERPHARTPAALPGLMPQRSLLPQPARAMMAAKVRAHAAHDEEVALRAPLGHLVLLRRAVLGHVDDLGQREARAVRLHVRRERGPEVREQRLDALRDDFVRAVCV